MNKEMLNQFIIEVMKALKSFPSWRKGQAVFNLAHFHFQEEANQLRATEYDCFHNDEKINGFMLQLFELMDSDIDILEHWYQSEFYKNLQ